MIKNAADFDVKYIELISLSFSSMELKSSDTLKDPRKLSAFLRRWNKGLESKIEWKYTRENIPLANRDTCDLFGLIPYFTQLPECRKSNLAGKINKTASRARKWREQEGLA